MAMHCQEAHEYMHLVTDHMLSSHELRELEVHLASCDACRQKERNLQQVMALLDAATMADPPPDMTSRVMRQIQVRNRRQRFVRAWMRGVMWTVLVASLIMLAIMGISSARDMLGSSQSVFASMLQNVVALYQLGATIAQGLRVILMGLVGRVDTVALAIYAGFAGIVAAIWVRIVARSTAAPAHSRGR